MAAITTPAQRIQNDIASVQALLEGETEYAAIENYSALVFALEDLLNADILDQMEYGYQRRWTDNVWEAVDKAQQAIARNKEIPYAV